MKITIHSSLASSLINFRGSLINDMIRMGHPISAISSDASVDDLDKFREIGINYNQIELSRNGLNIISDFKYLIAIIRCYFTLRPDIILSYTVKPIIWGGIASYFLPKNKYFAMVTGTGYAFQKGGRAKNILRAAVIILYRVSLRNATSIIFQNSDNLREFVELDIVKLEKCFLVNGSGVDLSHYKASTLPPKPHFLLIARLLGDKGIREYAKAAEIVKQQYPEAVFELVGPEDPSPDGIKLDEINKWVASGAIEYSGATTDVRPFIENCSIYVLPSYHEGMPRTVLEAMAMGRPILTTDVPGCRETVVDGENGWLVEKANVEQLAERMIWFIENQEQWSVMGEKSHTMANEKFDVHKVNAEILKIMGLSDEKTV
ncbi:glycosyltransferase family 4 protein [Vibrio kanaloae]|uniref:glycosyltransferase family 4 protein n=1 Tax=Vibrio kanaloae TaxID=170673 RepID=UPI001F52F825|nr:glycosyltransferase family 4 protein [Vibrio kanaloae]